MFCKSFLLAGLFIMLNILFLYFTAVTLEKRKWQKMVKKTVADPQNYRFILDQPKKCEQQKPFLVIIVPVAPQNVEARNAIRITWGSEELVQDRSVLVLFLLGSQSTNETQQEQLENESKEHQDLLQSSFLDSYRNLTIKTLVMMEWLNRNCPQASYGAKVDADVLLNMRNLLHMLVSLKSLQRNYITGLVITRSIVLRDPSSKFYVPHDVYPRSTYPPYPLGMCYIFSMDLPQKILHIFRYIKPIFIEDAYMGMCLKRLGIAPRRPPNIRQFVVRPPQRFNRCYYSRQIAILTDSQTQLISYWMDFHSNKSPC